MTIAVAQVLAELVRVVTLSLAASDMSMCKSQLDHFILRPTYVGINRAH
jgi:hypothetical protein